MLVIDNIGSRGHGLFMLKPGCGQIDSLEYAISLVNAADRVGPDTPEGIELLKEAASVANQEILLLRVESLRAMVAACRG